MDLDLLEKSKEQALNLSSLTGVNCCVLEEGESRFLHKFDAVTPNFCDQCPYNLKDEMKTHFYGLSEAKRWGGSFIYYCPEGLIFVANTLNSEDGELEGGVILGPIVMGEVQDTDCLVRYQELRPELEKVKKMSTKQVRQLCDVMSMLLEGVFAKNSPHATPYDQQQILNTIYDMRAKYVGETEHYEYILESESKLRTLIAQRDRAESQELLNRLLGHIYFYHHADIDELKARTLELIVVMSRAVIAGGADIGEIFRFSTTFIHELDHFSSIDEICVWLSGIVHRFMSVSFDYVDIKHADKVYKVKEYICDNFKKRITLDEIASSVQLSKSYLSSVFKQETATSITDYINKVRIEHGKRLITETDMPLVDVAHECCFEDQSYFTKVFKKHVGMPPGKFRNLIDKRGRVN